MDAPGGPIQLGWRLAQGRLAAARLAPGSAVHKVAAGSLRCRPYGPWSAYRRKPLFASERVTSRRKPPRSHDGRCPDAFHRFRPAFCILWRFPRNGGDFGCPDRGAFCCILWSAWLDVAAGRWSPGPYKANASSGGKCAKVRIEKMERRKWREAGRSTPGRHIRLRVSWPVLEGDGGRSAPMDGEGVVIPNPLDHVASETPRGARMPAFVRGRSKPRFAAATLSRPHLITRIRYQGDGQGRVSYGHIDIQQMSQRLLLTTFVSGAETRDRQPYGSLLHETIATPCTKRAVPEVAPPVPVCELCCRPLRERGGEGILDTGGIERSALGIRPWLARRTLRRLHRPGRRG